MSAACTFVLHSHFVLIKNIKPAVMPAIGEAIRQQIQYTMEKRRGRFVRTKSKVFAAKSQNGVATEYRFHINQLDHLFNIFGNHGIPKRRIEVVKREMYLPETCDFKIQGGKTPRENQIPLIEYIVNPGHTKVVTLQTGQGKTFCGLKAGELIGERIVIQVLGRFFEKWESDVAEAYGLDPERVVALRGAKKLKQFLDLYFMDPEGMSFDVLLITSKTIQDYISEYELTQFKHMPKGVVRPEDIYEMLGIGYRIMDEVHMHFHLNYKTDLYTHIPKGLYLSATLNPDDPFIKEMYNIAYPPSLRMDGGKFIKYCHVTSIDYQLKDSRQAKYLSPQGSYNHIVYEEWIMKDNDRLGRYLELIREVYEYKFLKTRKEGQKCLIFAGSVEMCEIISGYLGELFDEEVIEKYTSEDDYDVLMKSDTVVSTLGSSGTAVDIINLSVCIMTTALSTSQANLQAVGRLRELVNYKPDKPNFYYFTCLDISKHVDYKNKKKDILSGRALSHKSEHYPTLV